MPSKPSRKGNWKKEQKEDDVFVDDPREGDLVIPVMGPSGAGKSTFINILLGKDVASVGHDLQSHTAQIHHYFLPDSHRRIVVVDTPGFDDTVIDDREILRRIAVWLARSYNADMKLAGIIYLHEITQTRMLGTARKNLDMFYKLCGPDASKNIVLATTKWGEIMGDVGDRREQQLRDEHWKDIIGRGSTMARFERTQTSAQKIIKDILARDAITSVQIQSELVDIDKLLAETAAGQTLRYSLKDLLELQKRMAVQLRAQGGEDVRDQIIENDNKIRGLLAQIRALNIPLPRKILRMLGFVKT
ncbi:hypothetical protein H0H93_016304 [Arthromyces matolae]|nr:hypothetical protein H0H93_016304 [Arthromyces matolae]